jgi:hypothetical protein
MDMCFGTSYRGVTVIGIEPAANMAATGGQKTFLLSSNSSARSVHSCSMAAGNLIGWAVRGQRCFENVNVNERTAPATDVSALTDALFNCPGRAELRVRRVFRSCVLHTTPHSTQASS